MKHKLQEGIDTIGCAMILFLAVFIIFAMGMCTYVREIMEEIEGMKLEKMEVKDE